MRRFIKRKFLIIAVSTITFFSISLLLLPIKFSRKTKYVFNRTFDEITDDAKYLNKTLNDTKIILYWIPIWETRTFHFGKEGYDSFRNCEYRTCFVTYNKSLVPLEDINCVIFHTAKYSKKVHGKPFIRSSEQRYVFTNMEAPIRAYPSNLKEFDSFYNWTMTYRLDSDIFRPYGRILRKNTSYILPSVDLIKKKPKLVAWFVSHCFTINRRQELYKNLQRYIKIDVYGLCGRHLCPKDLHESSEVCYELIEKEYKFYLSFENSHCKDYVTEKLYRVLKRNIIPVVYGGGDYKNIAPPNSVIVADDYTNAKELADYLLNLDRNPELYLKYFEWKKSYVVEINDERAMCKLCEMLNNPLEPVKVYKDIYTWWVGKNHSNCKIGDGLSNKVVVNCLSAGCSLRMNFKTGTYILIGIPVRC